ncbi:MAG: NAD(P)/FAD-dependent oxidoreductase, partial [Saprospiraceae bacterium]|nr:NAD(P)/FAD-dependent oxidoreductase [Saprospiraceae bacterium]
RTWAELKKEEADALVRFRTGETLEVAGKSTFKEEFVTAGGVDLKEVDFRTFGARRFPGLYLAGEVLDIDAVTGGFNFQAAWTGGWLAGKAMAARHLKR